jgi:hypothetical protein
VLADWSDFDSDFDSDSDTDFDKHGSLV